MHSLLCKITTLKIYVNKKKTWSWYLIIFGGFKLFRIFTRGGTGLRFSGSGGLGRARALHLRAGVGLGPRPDYEVRFRAGSGFIFSGSGRVGLSHNYVVKALKF